jgi:hypothetical protein
MKRRLIPAALLIALAIALALTSGPPAATPSPPGTFSFAVLGDAPYYVHEELRFRLVLQDLDRHDLASVVHLGDIFWHPCTDAMYLRTRARFNALRHPVIYTPGDNEWSDCWEPGSGAFSPRERLAAIRRIFFNPPTRSLGATPIALTSQGGEFIENARWERRGIVFATVHLTGSFNSTKAFPTRTAADDAEVERRLGADIAWLRETFATAANAKAVVIVFHAGLSLELPVGHAYRKVYEPFIQALEEEAERFRKPVLIIHGDHHEFLVDHPIPRLANLTRMEVPGSPDVGWVRVGVNPGAATFTFENRVVPRWKYW